MLNTSGQLVVVGGSDGTHSLCTTEILDIQENIWKPGPTMTTCRANVAVAVVDDRIWAVGGFSGKDGKHKNYNKYRILCIVFNEITFKISCHIQIKCHF